MCLLKDKIFFNETSGDKRGLTQGSTYCDRENSSYIMQGMSLEVKTKVMNMNTYSVSEIG